MDIWKVAFRLAIRAMLAYKARTLLTMLGIIIGIGSVIVVISIGRGATVSIQEQINGLGNNMLMIWSGSSKKGGRRGGRGTMPTLRVKDAQAIARECPAVSNVTYLIRTTTQAVTGEKNWGTQIYGTTPEWVPVRGWPVLQGEFISPYHLKTGANVAVLGTTVAENLFEKGTEVIGRKVRLNNVPFRVIGVLGSKGQSSWGDQNDVIYVPYTTAVRKLMRRRLPGVVYFIAISAQSSALIPEAQREIEELLRQRHRILPNADDDFTVKTLDEYASAAEKTSGTMTLLLAAVAAVSLIVGGIGIMNIMLVSVTERTREIGIRMAVGARERDVMIQFLVEAVTMSITGGIIGTVLGVASAKLISHFADWPTIVTPGSIILASFFSMAVGVFFGFYPARKASKLDPIEALRYE